MQKINWYPLHWRIQVKSGCPGYPSAPVSSIYLMGKPALLEKKKGCSTSFQAKTCVVPDDVRLSSVGNHMPRMVSNYRRRRKCSRNGQEKTTHCMCAE
ncbi:hypothetical protein TNCV_694881 [Trichonephila clavipes]|nr:hypothetical protein TNCV_694881 [Trichonephila clavipes]